MEGPKLALVKLKSLLNELPFLFFQCIFQIYDHIAKNTHLEELVPSQLFLATYAMPT